MNVKIMTSIFTLFSFVVLFCSTSCKEWESDELILFDFEDEFYSKWVIATDASFKLIEDTENHFLRVNSGFVHPEPGIKLLEPKDNPWNLKGYYQVKADVSNTGDEFMQVQMLVGNDPNERTRKHCTNYVDLSPGETRTVTVNLSWTEWVYNPQPVIVGMRGIPGIIKTDLTAINELTFSSRYPKAANEFTIDNVRASGKVEVRDTTGLFPFIDEFGQYIHKDWKGKIHSIEELQESKAITQKSFLENPGPENRNKYGGWTAGPQLKKTGYFRTEKYNGKWWLVDPEGYLFWSAGMNFVASVFAITGVQYRENYFRNLPVKDSELGQFYGKNNWAPRGFYKGKTPFSAYNFYRANMYRKYGDQWLEEFSSLAHQRFRYWGMNTLGFASDIEVTRQHKTPYVGTVRIEGTTRIEASKAFWGKLHDVFDPGFRLAVRRSIERQNNGVGDPWCIGFYIDNELGWGQLGSISLEVLESPATQPAKKEFINDLKQKYQTIEALNKNWGTTHNSWDALLISTNPPDVERAKDDLAFFYEKLVITYFKTVKEEFKRVAPNQCYLGCRFGWDNNDVTLRTASKYMDIISFNKYEYNITGLRLPKGVDKPIIIGEFHFGALDRGNFHPGLKEAKNQAERGEFYQNYIQGALRNPFIVGAHWFQYIDQPITGCGGGENYNIGFVDICDNPYIELIDKVRETNYQMYEYRLNHKTSSEK